MNYSCLPMIYFKAIVLDQTWSLFDWLEIASGLPLDGTEIHWRMLPNAPGDLDRLRAALNARRLRVSQVTCAPDSPTLTPWCALRRSHEPATASS